MECKFITIENRCYVPYRLDHKTGETFYDLYQYGDGSVSKMWNIIDHGDLYLPPNEKEFKKLPLERILWWENKQKQTSDDPIKIVRFAHLLGTPADIFHSRDFESIHRRGSHQFEISAHQTEFVALALADNDTHNIFIPPPELMKKLSISDHDPNMSTILFHLQKIINGENSMSLWEKPRNQPFNDPNYEKQNRENAIHLLAFYAQEGSQQAKALLKNSQKPSLPKEVNPKEANRTQKFPQLANGHSEK